MDPDLGADNASSLTERLESLHEFHFELASLDSIDAVSRLVVEQGRVYAGVDRLGVWYIDPDDPDTFIGSFGIDEAGRLRDERAVHIRRDPTIYDDSFLKRRVPYRLLRSGKNYDHHQNPVGHGDLVVAPMWNGRDSVGAVSADNLLSGRRLTRDDCQIVALLARMAGFQVTLRRKEAELERLAMEDSLTGILNRATGLRVLEQQIAISRRTGMELSVAFVDLDGLKTVNDTVGHHAGDEFIREIAAVLDSVRRSSDALCRMGGDEFLVILPGTSGERARDVVARAQETAAASPRLRAICHGPWMSVGVAELGTEDDIDSLIRRADAAMYREKRTRLGDRTTR